MVTIRFISRLVSLFFCCLSSLHVAFAFPFFCCVVISIYYTSLFDRGLGGVVGKIMIVLHLYCIECNLA